MLQKLFEPVRCEWRVQIESLGYVAILLTQAVKLLGVFNALGHHLVRRTVNHRYLTPTGGAYAIVRRTAGNVIGTLDLDPVRIPALARPFVARGWVARGEYTFPEKKLVARHFEPPRRCRSGRMSERERCRKVPPLKARAKAVKRYMATRSRIAR